MKWIGRAAVAVVALLLVVAALVSYVLPGVVRSQAAKGVEAATGRKLAIGAVSIHPFTWKVELDDVTLSEVGGNGTFASFRHGEAYVSPGSLFRGAPLIEHLRVTEPRFLVIRTGPGTYNMSDLIKYLTMPIPALSLEDVAITGGSIDFLDRAFGREERHTVRDASILVPFLTTVPARAAEYGNPRFAATVDGAPLVVETQVRGLPRAPEVSATVDLKDVSLPVYLSYLPAEIPVEVKSGKLAIQGTATYRIQPETGPEVGWDGVVAVTEIQVAEPEGPFRANVRGFSVRSRVVAGGKKGVVLDGGAVEIRDLVVPFGAGDGMEVGLFSISDTHFDQKENRLDVGEILLADGAIRISRDRKGVFSPMPLLQRLEAKLPRSEEAAGEPVQYRVRKIEGKQIELSFKDGTRKELPSFTVSGLGFQAENLTGPLTGPIAFSTSARIGKDARVTARGKVVPTPLAADVEFELTGFALSSGGPYVPEGMDLSIADGRLDLRVAASVATVRDRMTGSYGGSATVRSLRVLDRKKGKLFAWDKLSVDGVKGDLEPMTLRISKVGLQGLRADLVQGEDGKLNLPGMSSEVPAKRGKPAPAAARGDEGFRSIRVDEFVLSDGVVNFTDRGVPGDFHATVRDIAVRATGMTTEPGKHADVRASMTLPKGAPLRISGKAAPLKSPVYADLDLVLEKLDLTTATPYAGAYLGLEIDRGALTVKSRAKVEKGTLAAENRIRVDQLRFGKSVKSDRATILPVQMIVDLMRDPNGDIVLDLPVTGKTDDENLTGTIVGQAVSEVIFPTTSPLRNIAFEGCSADLGGDAQSRLRKLAAALQDRPAMRVIAFGYVDRDLDAKACQERPMTGAAPPLEGEARLKQLAERRAIAVRDFLVVQGSVDASRVTATTGDVHAAPRQKGEAQARVEFARGTD